jgi:glutathione S-transferase
MDLESNSEVTLAYYPFRAKGQVCRLLCEYLRLPYRDRFFDPDQWAKFREAEAKEWIVRDLPFLQDGDFVAVGPVAIVTYIVEKANRTDLFGRTLQEKALVDSLRSKTDLCLAMLGASCSTRPTCEIENKKCMEYYWQHKIKPVLALYEKECRLDPWFLSDITIIDFVVYEAINLLEHIYPEEIGKL